MNAQEYAEYNAEADRILDKIRQHLDTPSELVYLDYNDYLDSDDVRALIDGDLDSVIDSIWDSWEDARLDGARFHVEQAVMNAGLTDEELEFYEDDIDLEWTLMDEVWMSSSQDLVADLARNTPDVTVMVPLIGEDDAEWSEERKASQLCELLGTTREDHYRTAKELISETPSDLGMAWVVFDVAPIDVYNGWLDKGVVKIINPCVVYGNPFTGGVWAANFRGLEFAASVKDVMNDGAWGYGCDEVWGCNPSNGSEIVYFAKDGTPTAPLEPGSLAHVDILRDYCDRWG